MTLTLLNVIYVLLAIAMIGFILVQRGAGAQAGSGFGGGASATVFGARGAGNFLTKSTAVLAAVFFMLSLGMGIYVARSGIAREAGGELGVMSDATTEEAPAPAAAPAGEVPAATEVPVAPAAVAPEAAPAASDVPAAPEAAKPEAETPKVEPER